MTSYLRQASKTIDGTVKEVKVTGRDVLLTYTIPMPPEGILQESMGVLNLDFPY